jgi:hypothetical protein
MHANGLSAHSFTDIAANPGVSFALNCADKPRFIAVQYSLNQHLPHAPRGAGDGDCGGLSHDILLSCLCGAKFCHLQTYWYSAYDPSHGTKQIT